MEIPKNTLKQRLPKKEITKTEEIEKRKLEHKPFDVLEFLFNTPLYKRVDVHTSPIIISTKEASEVPQYSLDDTMEFNKLFNSSTKFDGFNPIKKQPTTFVLVETLAHYRSSFIDHGGIRTIKLKCTRYEDEIIFYIYWDAHKGKLSKIGQYPSLADFHLHELKKYNNVINESVLKEFAKGMILASMGFGIGSFVYLRRIFENLIFETFEKHKATIGKSSDEFKLMKMDKRIELLQNELPELIVKNELVYQILSLGIHQLDEDTCNASFNTIRMGIELILDQKVELIKKEKKRVQIENEIQALNKKLKEGKI